MPDLDIALYEEKAREAEREAEQAEDGSAAKANWAHLAIGWRLLADRTLADFRSPNSIGNWL
jgi:hypothetical protein